MGWPSDQWSGASREGQEPFPRSWNTRCPAPSLHFRGLGLGGDGSSDLDAAFGRHFERMGSPPCEGSHGGARVRLPRRSSVGWRHLQDRRFPRRSHAQSPADHLSNDTIRPLGPSRWIASTPARCRRGAVASLDGSVPIFQRSRGALRSPCRVKPPCSIPIEFVLRDQLFPRSVPRASPDPCMAVGPGSVLFREGLMLVKQRQAARQRRKEARKARSAARAVCETLDAARKPLEIRTAQKTKTGIWISGLDFGLRGRRRARG